MNRDAPRLKLTAPLGQRTLRQRIAGQILAQYLRTTTQTTRQHTGVTTHPVEVTVGVVTQRAGTHIQHRTGKRPTDAVAERGCRDRRHTREAHAAVGVDGFTLRGQVRVPCRCTHQGVAQTESERAEVEISTIFMAADTTQESTL
jgi:hypothetical protein